MSNSRDVSIVSPTKPIQPEQQAASIAYAKVEPEFKALLPEQVLRVNLDITKAASLAIAAMPGIMALRAELVATVPQFPVDKLDRLQDYALACWYAHILAMPPTSEGSPAQPLLEEAGPLRQTLLVGAQALAHKGFFDPERVADIQSGSGHFDASTDLVALARMYQEKWPEIEHRTAVDKTEVDRADVLGTELIVALGPRLMPSGEPLTAGQASENRARAFTLFMDAYDTCRRAVFFLRWSEGDAEQITPSLFVRNRSRRVQDPGEPPAEPTVPSPPAPGPQVPTPQQPS